MILKTLVNLAYLFVANYITKYRIGSLENVYIIWSVNKI